MDTFYIIEKKDLYYILNDAKNLSFSYNIDYLDNTTPQRKSSNLTYDEFVKIMKNESSVHDVFIKRDSYRKYISGFEITDDYYYEVGMSNLSQDNTNLTYYIFIYLTKENGEKLIEKYNLKPLN